MRTLSIDLETYSDIDLTTCGVYAYAASPSFEIVLMAYAYDEGEIKLLDLANGERIPEELKRDLFDEQIIKTAFHAQFERICLSRYWNTTLSSCSWRCTSVQAAMLGLPFSLAGVAHLLGLEEQKYAEGKDLIRYFSLPCKPVASNHNRTRNRPADAPEKWEQFKRYCMRDVEVERAIRMKLKRFPIPDAEQRFYQLDQTINDRGILVDEAFINQAIQGDQLFRSTAFETAKRISGLDNPNSVSQMKAWLEGQGIEVEQLSKNVVMELAKHAEADVEQLLRIRLQLAKTSIKKYEAMKRVRCPDGRVHGLLQFYGANRTGRWAGRLVQIQNLPQNHLSDLTLARTLVKKGQLETVDLLYESVPHVLSELIRTAFIPAPGHQFLVVDFSAIEARIIAWLARETWRMDVFQSHGKIYEASASRMFHVPMEAITKGSPLRQKGKIAELALGYGGGVGALRAMGACEMGLSEDELQPLVQAWRAANPRITELWWTIDHAAVQAVKEKTTTQVGPIVLQFIHGILWVRLPSGRMLSYIKPRMETNAYGRDGLTYEGIGEGKRWDRISTYGPKLVENIVQGIARDVLAESMLKLDEAGYRIVMHVHDEVVIESPVDQDRLDEICRLMQISPSWANDLLLRADGFSCDYYRKE
jgi:DNA polymerase